MKVGVRTPRLAVTAPGMPAAWMPAKVAQFRPRGPGVISAMATMSDTSLRFIQPWETTSWEIRGIMDRPPKLVKPIFTKLQNSSSSVRIMMPHLPSLIIFTDQNAADHSHRNQGHAADV